MLNLTVHNAPSGPMAAPARRRVAVAPGCAWLLPEMPGATRKSPTTTGLTIHLTNFGKDHGQRPEEAP